MTDRCPTCDRPDGWGPAALTPEWIAAHPNADGCECPMCVALCWDSGGPQCLSGAVDWRARALQAERERDEARAERDRAREAVGLMRAWLSASDRCAPYTECAARLGAVRAALESLS